MLNINSNYSNYNVMFKGDYSKKKANRQQQTIDFDYNTFEFQAKKSKGKGILGKIIEFCTPNVTKKYKKFIENSQQKIKIAMYEFEKIHEKSQQYYDEANELLEEVENGTADENIKFHTLAYKNNTYTTIAETNDDGFIDKIIHAKDGKIYSIYDIKSELKAGKSSLIHGSPTQKTVADCYFYNQEEDNLFNFEYMKNIKNSALNFSIVYDTENGGIKQVRENKNFAPIEEYIIGDDNSFKYWFDYGKKDEEKVSFCNLDEGRTRTKYTQKSFPKNINKLETVKSYFQYNNPDGTTDYKLAILHPKRSLKEYTWG